MKHLRVAVAALAMALAASNAVGQPDDRESVTVQGRQEAVQGFVDAISVESGAENQLARWDQRVCPSVTGLSAAHGQATGLEAPFAPADGKRVTISAEQSDFLAPELKPGAGARWWWRRRRGLRQTLDANNCLPAAEIRHCAINHLDAIDNAFVAAQIKRVRAFAAAQNPSHLDVVGLSIAVDDLEVEHLDVSTSGEQPYGAEATIASSHPKDVTVHSE